MKTFLFRISLLLGVLTLIPFAADAIIINNINYTLNSTNMSASIAPNQSETLSGIIDIPASVTFANMTFNVNSISAQAFNGCPLITEFRVSSNSNFSTQNGILYNWSKTELIAYPRAAAANSVVIPSSVTSILPLAFDFASNLVTITLPENLVTIKGSAFRFCDKLTTIIVPQNVISLGDSAFCGCTSLETITLPSTMTSIGSHTFEGCTNLKSITLPQNLSQIDYMSLAFCTNLESINFGNSLTVIPENLLNGSQKLSKVTIPSNVNSIKYGAFSYCSLLSEVHCKATTPPVCENNVFMGTLYQSGILYIPKGTMNSYMAVSPWKDFSFVMEETITNDNQIEDVNSITIKVIDSKLKISGLNRNENVYIFNTEGKVIGIYQYRTDGIDLPPLKRGVYIVKTNGLNAKFTR